MKRVISKKCGPGNMRILTHLDITKGFGREGLQNEDD